MTLPAALYIAISLVALYLAITSLRLSRAFGWHDERWLVVIALSAAVYSAMDIPTTLAVSDALINGLNSVQAVAAGTNIAAWLIYSRMAVGRAPSRRVMWLAAIFVALAALAVIPGVGFTGRVLLVECPLLGVTYRLSEPTFFGSVLYGAYTLTFVGIAVHFALAWRRGVPGAAVYCIAIGIVVVAAVNDLLVLTGLLHTPALLDIVYVVPVVAAVLSLTGRVVRDAAVLGDLSAGLERQVAQRTKELHAAMDELERTHDLMVQSEKMAVIGQLAAGVAHEINNPLSYVQANLDVLRDYSTNVGALWLSAKAAARYLRGLQVPDAARHARSFSVVGGSEDETESLIRDIAAVVDETLDGGRRIAELVSGFRRLAEPPDVAPRARIDVAALARECVAELTGRPGHLREIVCEAEACATYACGADLHLALLNILASLCLERGGGMAEAGRISLRVGLEGGRPAIIIVDDALSLSEVERRRLFDPRVEVDSRHGRTMRLNLSLALAHAMLARNGAEVFVEAPGDRGVRFRIALAGLESTPPLRT